MDGEYLKNLFGERNDLLLVSRDVDAEIQRLKQNLQRITQDAGIDLEPLLTENNELTKKVEELEQKLERVSHEVNAELKEEYEVCSLNLENLRAKKQTEEDSLIIVDFILNANSEIGKIEDSIKNASTLEGCTLLCAAEKLIKDNCHLDSLILYKNLVIRLQTAHDKIADSLTSLWLEAVQYEIEVKESISVTKICISKKADIREILWALCSLGETTVVKKFLVKLNDHVLMKIVKFKTKIYTDNSKEKVILVLSYETNAHPSYLEAFKNILQSLEFLRDNFNFELPESGTIVNALGNLVDDACLESMMTSCLYPSLPSQLSQEAVRDIVSHAEQFQATLVNMGFLSADSKVIMEEVNKVGHTLKNKAHERYLETARNIMKKDLHTVVDTPTLPEPDWSCLPSQIFDVIETEFAIRSKNSFGSCKRISKSAEELLTLVESIVEKLKSDSESGTLIKTMRNIFELYTAIMPLYHKKFLAEIPQVIAIFHNNCLHFAHYLLFLACKCRSWSSNLQNEYHIFLDEAVVLAQLAEDSITHYVTAQRLQIIEIIDESGLGKLKNDSSLDPSTEKHMRQCIRQIQILNNVWLDLLPAFVFSPKIGYLATALTENVVRRIVNLNDISVALCTDLVQLLAVLQERLSKLLTGIEAVTPSNRHWSRLIQLQLVLNYSLDDISKKWDFGEGPLAKAFEKWEMMNMIRAIFKNTERRSALLNLINSNNSIHS